MKTAESVSSRLREHMERMLEDYEDLSVSELATSFSQANDKWLRTIDQSLRIDYLKRLSGDLLRRRTGIGEPGESVQLPLGLAGLRVPPVISYVSMAKTERHCLTGKADLSKLESHLRLVQKHYTDVGVNVHEFERLLKAVRPVMKTDPKMTLNEAFKELRRRDEPTDLRPGL
jgi:hypothetical protein